MIHRLHAAFTTELEPKNFIERMWVLDMAIQSAMLEYVRRANCAVHRLVQEDVEPADEQANAEESDVAAHSAEKPRETDRTLGKAFTNHLELISRLLTIERGLMHERDHLIRGFDTRTGTVQDYQDAMKLLDKLIRDQIDGER